MSENHLFKGILICADCGSRLQRVKKKGNPITYYFTCPARPFGTSCTIKTINEAVLYENVLREIRRQIKTAANLSAMVENLYKQKLTNTYTEDLSDRINIQRKEIKRLTDLRVSLYESYAEKKLLTEDEYIYAKQQYNNQLGEANQQLERLLEENILFTETHAPQNKWLQLVQKFTEDDELTSEMVNHFLLHVIVREKDEFNFIWKLKSEYEALLEYIMGAV